MSIDILKYEYFKYKYKYISLLEKTLVGGNDKEVARARREKLRKKLIERAKVKLLGNMIGQNIKLEGVEYNIIQLLGKGTHGTAYLCKHEEDFYALKFINYDITRECVFWQKFMIKYKSMKEPDKVLLNHNIMHFVACGIYKNDYGTPFTVLAGSYVGNCSLRSLRTTVPDHNVAEIFEQLVLIIAVLHKYNMTHNDINPDNIIVRGNIDNCVLNEEYDFKQNVVFIDFGLSYHYDSKVIETVSELYSYLTIYGTPSSRLIFFLNMSNLESYFFRFKGKQLTNFVFLLDYWAIVMTMFNIVLGDRDYQNLVKYWVTNTKDRDILIELNNFLAKVPPQKEEINTFAVSFDKLRKEKVTGTDFLIYILEEFKNTFDHFFPIPDK